MFCTFFVSIKQNLTLVDKVMNKQKNNYVRKNLTLLKLLLFFLEVLSGLQGIARSIFSISLITLNRVKRKLKICYISLYLTILNIIMFHLFKKLKNL